MSGPQERDQDPARGSAGMFADPLIEWCPGHVGRGTGERCCMCSRPIPEGFRRKEGDPSDVDPEGCGDCRNGVLHTHQRGSRYGFARPVERVLSGDQLVQPDGSWDRVCGVDHEAEPGVAVFVTTDRAKRVRYELGTTVRVV